MKIAFYWAASCGGCEIAVTELAERIITVAEKVDFVFWPVAMDFKYKDVEAMPDKHIDLCLFNGGIRTSEHEEMARLLRAKSKIMCAFGACAHLGGVPSLANFFDREGIFRRAYIDSESTVNPSGTLPMTAFDAPEGTLDLPSFYDTVCSLDQVVEVDYYVPGCPPYVERIWEVLLAVLEGNLPPAGSVVGAGDKTCCDECPRVKEEKKINRFHRPHEIVPEPEKCLLEQGLLCMGPATRAGCEARCLSADMPCRGCYGPPPGALDQGTKMLSAIASVIDSEDPDEINEIVSQIVDPAGSLYRFATAASLLRRARRPTVAAADEVAAAAS
ncbi:MAG: oxidoreductase [Armatimonadota bacterium]